MAWTTPKTWVSGDVLTASDMNAFVRDNTDFIQNTAYKKFLVTTGSLATATNFSGAGTEATVTTLAVADPTFPSTSYLYVAWSTFTILGVAAVAANQDTQIITRDNAVGGTAIARGRIKEFAINDSHSISTISVPVTVTGGGARTVYYRVITGTVDAQKINATATATFFGAFLVPV